MSDLAGFPRDVAALVDQLAALPDDIRAHVDDLVHERVIQPLVDDIRGRETGPYGSALAGAITVAGDAPAIEVVSAGAIVSGGASADELVWGSEYGGGERVSIVSASTRAKSYKRHTTRQFRGGWPVIVPTVEQSADQTVERFADVVDETLEVIRRG